MSRTAGDWIADREMLAEAAADPSLSDGAVRMLCLARVGVIGKEEMAWAKAALAKFATASDLSSSPEPLASPPK